VHRMLMEHFADMPAIHDRRDSHIFEAVGDSEAMEDAAAKAAKLVNEAALNQKIRGDFVGARASCLRALKLYKKVSRPRRDAVARCLSNIALRDVEIFNLHDFPPIKNSY
jgi:hypothetical protein